MLEIKAQSGADIIKIDNVKKFYIFLSTSE